MCKAVEEYAINMKDEGILESKIKTIRNLLKENMPLEKALECAELDKNTYDKYIADKQ